MLRLNQYQESWELTRKWIKLLDKYIPRGIVVYYGGFYRGEIKKPHGGWKEVILVVSEDYDIKKQFRTGRDHFLEQAATRRFELSYTARSCFLTPEMAEKYYNEHQKIGVSEFKDLIEWGDARYLKGRRFTFLVEGGKEYDTI